jgi:hypothetical protein
MIHDSQVMLDLHVLDVAGGIMPLWYNDVYTTTQVRHASSGHAGFTLTPPT